VTFGDVLAVDSASGLVADLAAFWMAHGQVGGAAGETVDTEPTAREVGG
jgi:hypothetical protein